MSDEPRKGPKPGEEAHMMRQLAESFDAQDAHADTVRWGHRWLERDGIPTP